MELPASVPTSRLSSAAAVHGDDSPADSDDGPKSEHHRLNIDVRKTDLYAANSTHRQDTTSRNVTRFEMPADEFIPMALDPNIADGPSPSVTELSQQQNGKDAGSVKVEPETLGSDYFNVKEKSSKRKPIKDARAGALSRKVGSQSSSPIVSLKQEDNTERRKPLGNTTANMEAVNNIIPSKPGAEQEKFKLQEAPKRRKSSGQQYTTPGPKEGFPTLSLDSSPLDLTLSDKIPSLNALREQHVNIGQSDSARSSQLDTPTQKTPLIAQDTSHGENTLEIPNLPKRGDSLQKSPLVQRKEVPGSRSVSYEDSHDGKSPVLSRSHETSSTMNGGLVIGRPIESPISKSVNAMTGESGDDSANGDSFVSPRAAPPRPAESNVKHKTRGSVGTIRSESRNGEVGSPGITRFQQSEAEEGRMTEDGGQGFFTRTFSKSARHARSHSDRGSRNSREHKWTKTTMNGTGVVDQDLASPTLSSPDAKGGEVSQATQELARVRYESYVERQRNQDLEARVAELENALEGRATISKVNSELREKRSTIVVLDTQKEIIIRELEVITEHLQAAKSSDKKLDLSSMQQKMLKDFVDELNKLRDSYTPQIEELIQQKSELQDDFDQILQKRDRAFKEFEQLSGKNAQLADLNNQLVGTIQELQSKIHPHEYKGSIPGLGIYTHHSKERSNLSVDSRDLNNSISESHFIGSTMTGDQVSDSATILHAPQIVNIQKGQASKRSYWKKGSTMAKGMKGLKGAFTSTENKPGRDGFAGGLTEGIPYGQMVTGNEPMAVTTLSGAKGSDIENKGFGFFGQQKGRTGILKPTIQNNFANPVAAEPSGELPASN